MPSKLLCRTRIIPQILWILIVFATFYLIFQSTSSTEPFASPPVTSSKNAANEIPNIAHFTMVGNTNMSFLQWLAIESADYYLNPNQIYIHAESPPVGKWAEKIQRKRNVIVRKPDNIFTMVNGHKLIFRAHVSDFIRAKVLYDYGGIYFDLDAIPLRDFAKLRKSGFDYIVGVEADLYVGVGLLMAVPKSKLIGEWYETMQKVYDGEWSTHSVQLLTKLLSKYRGDTLILHQDSFFPFSWEKRKLESLFTENADKFNWDHSWAMHLYNSAASTLKVKGYLDMTIKKILKRNSNFARAVWNVVVNALDKETISLDDVKPGDIQAYLDLHKPLTTDPAN
ncbi:nucleotide-diphospho-sugar transferase [Paraphysoderma sedebokerense]|nr:nucleotide-diphospho-sugar transferase [Paraphysoderma sedebokerense]